MRRNRIAALVLFVLSLISISFKGGPVSYGFFYFTLFVPLVSFVYTQIVYLRFKIYQEIDTRTIVAGSSTPFYFTLQNEDKFTHSGVKTGFFSDFSYINGLDPSTEYELMPETGIRKETLLVCKYRGEYEVGIKSVTVTDYLRLFSITFKNKETLKVQVSPRLEILNIAERPDMIVASSENPPRDKKVPDILVREYIPGDDIRMINWKATARVGKPMVKALMGEDTPSVRIIMDSYKYSEKPEEYLPLENKILETVLALVYYYAENGIDASVSLYNDQFIDHKIGGTDSFEEFYAGMSGFCFRRDNEIAKLIGGCERETVPSSAESVVFVLHKWTDEVSAYSAMLSGNTVRQSLFLITDDPAESGTAAVPSNVGYRVVGYEDRLNEVLG